jgi:hypothetical protein
MEPLNTHAPASLDEAWAPAEAKRRADRRASHSTPQHGSGLNRAEIERSVRRRDRPARSGDRAARKQPLSAGEQRRHRSGPKANGPFPTTDARIK